jgi:hypothetical protein
MGMNRIQFQARMNVSDLHQAYGSEAQCEAALTEARWALGFVCPHCDTLHAASSRLRAIRAGNAGTATCKRP